MVNGIWLFMRQWLQIVAKNAGLFHLSKIPLQSDELFLVRAKSLIARQLLNSNRRADQTYPSRFIDHGITRDDSLGDHKEWLGCKVTPP